MKCQGVTDEHHMHVWALSTTENALTAHLVIKAELLPTFNTMKKDLRHRLQHMSINHATFEPEVEEEDCKQLNCD